MICSRCGAPSDSPVLPVDTDRRPPARVQVDILSVRVNDINELVRTPLCRQCLKTFVAHLRRILYPAPVAA